jgi:hypothetical protein
MKSPRSIFWMNGAKIGAENLCELDDPRQTCIAMNAGEFKSDEEATRLGIMQYLYGGESAPQGSARGMTQEAPDPKVTAEESAKGSAAVRQSQMEHEVMRPLSVEERSYVENAVVAGHKVMAQERAVAGEMGAEFTGPSQTEVTQAGGDYREAADKAAQAQGLTGEERKPEERKPEEPKPPEPAAVRTTPPRQTT